MMLHMQRISARLHGCTVRPAAAFHVSIKQQLCVHPSSVVLKNVATLGSQGFVAD
jgi:hypothetical protein